MIICNGQKEDEECGVKGVEQTYWEKGQELEDLDRGGHSVCGRVNRRFGDVLSFGMKTKSSIMCSAF